MKLDLTKNKQMEMDGVPEGNGGTVQEIEFEQVTKDSTTSTTQHNPIKEPIFIGGVIDSETIKKIEDLFDPNVYEVAMMSEQLHKSCRETYFFEKLGQEEKKNIIRVRNDAKSRETAFEFAIDIDSSMRNSIKQKDGSPIQKDQNIAFKLYELKALYKSKGKNLSNRQLEEIIDLLQIQGYAILIENSSSPMKRTFTLTIDSVTKMKAVQYNRDSILASIENLKLYLEIANREIEEISNKINEEANSLPEVVEDQEHNYDTEIPEVPQGIPEEPASF